MVRIYGRLIGCLGVILFFAGFGFCLTNPDETGPAQASQPPKSTNWEKLNDTIREIETLLRQNKSLAAEEKAQWLVDAIPGPRSWYTLGTVLFREQKYLEAYAALKNALTPPVLESLTRAKIMDMLGGIDLNFGNYDLAIDWLTKGLRLPDSSEDLKNEMASLLEQARQKKEVSQWKTRTTQHIEFHYPALQQIDRVVDELAAEYDARVAAFILDFKVPADPLIRFYLYPDQDTFRRLNPGSDRILFELRGQAIYAWPDASLPHEFEHLLVYRINNRNYPSYFISEGFTEYLVNRQAGADLHRTAARMVQGRGLLPSWEQMNRLEFFQASPESFSVAGSFIGYLVQTFGWEKMLAFWKSAKGPDQDPQNILGSPMPDLLQNWLDYLRRMQLSPDLLFQPFIQEILLSRLYADGEAILSARPSTTSLERLFLALCQAGRLDFTAARRSMTSLGTEPDALAADLPPAWRARALLLAGQLADLAAERDRALSFYRAGLALADVPTEIRDSLSFQVTAPCQEIDFRSKPQPDKFQRAEHLVRYRLATGLTTEQLAGAVCQSLDPVGLKTIYRNLDLPYQVRFEALRPSNPSLPAAVSQKKFQEIWDKACPGLTDLAPFRKVLADQLTPLPAEMCLRALREAGISITEIQACLERQQR